MPLESNMPRPSSSLKHYTLQAGAGAGKTKHLIDQMFSTMIEHQKKYNQCPKLTATTFTQKAAYEVKERIMLKAVSQNDWTLINALFNPSQIWVSTLHSILYSFLQRYAFTFSIDFMNTSQVQFLSRSIARNLFLENHSFFTLLRHYTFNELCVMLIQYDQNKRYRPQFQFLNSTEIQKDWMQHIRGIANLIAKSNAPDFQKLNENPLEIQEEDIQIWLKNNEKIIDSSIKKQLKELQEQLPKHHPKHAKNMEENYMLFSQLAEKFQIRWAEEKFNKRYIQIEDLELMALENIRKHPSRISEFSKEWDYWFIDEYQDISPIQETLLHHLTQHAQSVWTVGDPQQSIYLFRKADPNVFERRKQLTQKEKGQFEEKNINFRSESELIEFFNDFFKPHFRPIQPQKPALHPEKKAAYFLTYTDSIQQNEVIALRLNQLLNQDCSQEQTSNKICLLVKTNDDVRSLFHFLKKLKFPVQAHSAQSLKREVIDMLFVLRFLIQPSDNKNLIGLLRTPCFYIPARQIAPLAQKGQSLWGILKKQLKRHPVVQSLTALLNSAYMEGYSETLNIFLEKHLMIDLSFYQDPTGEYEHQLWRLLSELKHKEKQPCFQHSKFVSDLLNKTQFYNLESQTGSTSSVKENFIQIMTIHQSKGLEFDRVIIPGIDKNLKISDTKRFCFYEDQWSFSIKNQYGDPISPCCQSLWKKKEADQKLIEQDRVLYVAMTRAKKDITLIYSQKSLNKKSTPNWINRFPYFQKIHQTKPSFKNYSIEVQSISEIHDPPVCCLKPRISQQPLSPYKSIGPHTGPQKAAAAAKKNPCSIHSVAGSIRGLSLHQKLYSLYLSSSKKTFLNQIEDLKERKAVEYVMSLQTPPIESLIHSSVSGLKAEWGFVLNYKGCQASGRIDLWGEVNGHIWIIDYKSSAYRQTQEVWRQLGFYALALKQKHPENKMSVCIIQPFIQKKEIRPVTSEMLKTAEQTIIHSHSEKDHC